MAKVHESHTGHYIKPLLDRRDGKAKIATRAPATAEAAE
jgi:hypothetical protein